MRAFLDAQSADAQRILVDRLRPHTAEIRSEFKSVHSADTDRPFGDGRQFFGQLYALAVKPQRDQHKLGAVLGVDDAVLFGIVRVVGGHGHAVHARGVNFQFVDRAEGGTEVHRSRADVRH